MGYHSADYDHDWNIGVAELSRVAFLAGANLDGVVTGCYKVDPSSIDGFARDNNRGIDEPVVLTQYHSADYNRDGRIDANELARVQELYNYRYADTPLAGNVRTGQYHDDDPDSVDGFGLGPVKLSAYEFDEKSKPIISSNWLPDGTYSLRAKFTGKDTNQFQAATSYFNNGLVLDTLPPPGVYDVELYWVQWDTTNPNNYTTLKVGGVCKVVVVIADNKTDCAGKPLSTCICGDLDTKEPILEDKGQCFPFKEKRTCSAPQLPIPECRDTKAYAVSTPGQTPPFYVVSRLFDSLCDPITDQDGKEILTISK